MKKLAVALTIIGLGLGVESNAQTLLYQWAFTNVTDTASNSATSYAITPGTGNLTIQNVAGNVFGLIGYDAINPTVYFTNHFAGPGSGPGVDANAAFVANGQGYNGGNTAIAVATNLNLGTLYQYTMTFWVRMSSFDVGQYPRLVNFGATANYDAGGKGTVFNGTGTSVNTAPTGFPCVQNGVGGPTGSSAVNYIMAVTNAFVNGLPYDDTTWTFEAITYDGTTSTLNFVNWVGLTSQSVQIVTGGLTNAPEGAIQFGTNACALIGGNTINGNPRSLSVGAIADVRIYSGIVVSNDLEKIRQFQIPDLTNNPVLSAAQVTTQPQSGNSFVGGTRTFSVQAFGTPPVFTYLWRSNSVPVSGGTNASLTISNLQLGASGASFVCSVSNSIGGTNSNPAIVTVLPVSSGGDYAKAVLSYNPYSFWEVNEASNTPSVAIFDYVGGHDGVAVNPGNMTFAGGPASLQFYGFPTNNASIGTIRGTGQSRLNLTGPGNYVNSGMTIAGWVYAPGYGGGGGTYSGLAPSSYGMIFSLASDIGQGFGLFFGNNIAAGGSPGPSSGNGSEVDYEWGTTTLPTFNSGLYMNTNEWTFVALVISTNATPDTNATIYIGSETLGLLSTNDSTAATGDQIVGGSSLGSLALGRNTFTGSENNAFPYLGTTSQYSDVAVFYSALSPSAITNLFLNGVGLHLNGVRDPGVAGNLLMNWTYGQLQSAINVAGPYSNVAGTSNTVPYSVPMSGQKFYRVAPKP
jgi:hypothetical protein